MGDILGYARVSTNDQDVAGQTMRLTQAAAIKVIKNPRSKLRGIGGSRSE
jgi:DNA invertase Pin-like site-specific DNA recombinase